MANNELNPFTSEVVARPNGGGLSVQANTDSQRAIAEVQAAMMIARANPRDQIAAMDKILNACTRPTLAEKALYSYARGGTEITGPSIRLAEAIAQQWGNIQFGIRELEQRPDMSTVQAYAWDVETNTRREVTFQVQLVRNTKKGSYRLEDARDIYEMVANQGSRRVRACILAVIPGDVVEAAIGQCEATLKTKADTSPEAMKKMVEAFWEFGVSKEQIEKRIQRRIESIQPAQVISLKKIYISLRDDMSKPGDWFEPVEAVAEAAAAAAEPATKTEGLKGKLKGKAKAEPEAPKEEPAKEADDPVPHDPETGEVTDGGEPEAESTGLGFPEAMELGRKAREAGRPRRAPAEWSSLPNFENLAEAWLQGWNDRDAEMSGMKNTPSRE